MENLRWPFMTEQEVDDFLGKGGTGVISFSSDENHPPYSLPVSYGYDEETGHLHFKLAFPPNSGKANLIERPVSFVTHTHTAEGWRSIVATGVLKEVTGMAHESAAVQEQWGVGIPFVDIFEEPPEDVTFRHFRLVHEEFEGRKQISKSQ